MRTKIKARVSVWIDGVSALPAELEGSDVYVSWCKRKGRSPRGRTVSLTCLDAGDKMVWLGEEQRAYFSFVCTLYVLSL